MADRGSVSVDKDEAREAYIQVLLVRMFDLQAALRDVIRAYGPYTWTEYGDEFPESIMDHWTPGGALLDTQVIADAEDVLRWKKSIFDPKGEVGVLEHGGTIEDGLRVLALKRPLYDEKRYIWPREVTFDDE